MAFKNYFCHQFIFDLTISLFNRNSVYFEAYLNLGSNPQTVGPKPQIGSSIN